MAAVSNNTSGLLLKIPLIVYYGIFFYLLFFYPNSLNLDPVNKHKFILLFLSVGFFITSAVFNYFNNRNEPALYVFFILFFCSFFFLDYSFSNEYYLVISSFFLISYAIFLGGGTDSQSLITAIFISYLIELFFGTYELVSNITYSGFSIAGTFENSGMYCCFLCVCMPVSHYVFLHYIIKYKKANKIYLKNVILIVYIFCVVATIVIFVLNQARTPLFITILFFLFKIKNLVFPDGINLSKFWKFILLSVTLVFLIFVLSYFFYFKEMSSFGRLLIWKISFSKSMEHFWFGIGLGKFSYLYPFWQANYFASIKEIPVTEFLVAGETYYAFNEWLQLFVELGLIRFLIILYILFVFFIKQSNKGTQLSVLKQVFLISFLSGLTTYSFHLNPVLFIYFNIMVIWFSEFIYLRKSIKDSFYLRYGSIAIIVILCIKPTYSAYLVMSNIDQLSYLENSIGKRGIGKDYINKKSEYLYGNSNSSPSFLQSYSELILNVGGNTRLPLKDYQESTQKFISYPFLVTLAELYIANKDYDNAGKILMFLIHWIPSKYDCKIKLLRLYVKMNKIREAKDLADVILKMPTKVRSYHVDLIKGEVSVLKNKLSRLR